MRRCYLLNLSVDSYHCFVFFALSCASKNTFHGGNKKKLSVYRVGRRPHIRGLTLSLSHLKTLPECHRNVTGLSTTSRRAESGKVLCLVDDFD